MKDGQIVTAEKREEPNERVPGAALHITLNRVAHINVWTPERAFAIAQGFADMKPVREEVVNSVVLHAEDTKSERPVSQEADDE